MLVEAGTSGALEANIAASLAGLYGLHASFDAAREMAKRADSIYAALGLQLASAGLSQVVGPTELLAGDAKSAEREIRRGLAILEPSGAHGYQEALLAQVLYEQGRLEEAAKHIEAGARNAAPDNVTAQVLWRSVRAKLEAEEAPKAALTLAREAVDLAEATESPNLLADALSDLSVVLRVSRAPRRPRCPPRVEFYSVRIYLRARRVADVLRLR